MADEVTFTNRAMTVWEYLLVQRLQKNDVDVEAIIALVTLRADPPIPTEAVLRLSLAEFSALSERMFESLKTGAAVANLGLSMLRPSEEEQS